MIRVYRKVNKGTTSQVRWLNVLENLVWGPGCTVRVSTRGVTPLLHGVSSTTWYLGATTCNIEPNCKAGYKNLDGWGYIFCFVSTGDKLLLPTFKGDLKSYLCWPLTFIKLKRLWGSRMAVTSRAVRGRIIGCDLRAFTANRRCDCSSRCGSVPIDGIYGPPRNWTAAERSTVFAQGLCTVELWGTNSLRWSQTSGFAVGVTRKGVTSQHLEHFQQISNKTSFFFVTLKRQ